MQKNENAIESFDQSIRLNSSFPTTYYNKSFCLCNMGKYNDALDSLDKAISLNPNYDKAIVLKNSCLAYILKT
jgi:tetratricopeptide (TPR) repeat protein